MQTCKEYSISEVAILAEVHENTVRKWIRTGALKAHRKTNQKGIPWKIDADALSVFLIDRNRGLNE